MRKFCRCILSIQEALVISIAVCFFSLPACAEDARQLSIVTTLFPLYDFTRQICTENVQVSLLLPPGVEAHTFEPRPSDIVMINKADVFIYMGQYMEPWVHEILHSIKNKELLVVDASQGIRLLDESSEQESFHDFVEPVRPQRTGFHHRKQNTGDTEHVHEGKDPHIWLDLANAQLMVDTISDAVSGKDRSGASAYRRNAAAYKKKLAVLDKKFQETLGLCRLRTFIYGGHFAFGYFVRRYQLQYFSPYKGFSPNAEPTPQRLSELMRKMRDLKIKYLYYEELINPKVAQMISGETGAQLLLLHGAHNIAKKDLDAGITFIDIMEQNLENLKKGLDYQAA